MAMDAQTKGGLIENRKANNTEWNTFKRRDLNKTVPNVSRTQNIAVQARKETPKHL